jgi:outer membrane protein OmpA-like peptidoglycan-associated protein
MKYSLIILVIAMTFGFISCKKEEAPKTEPLYHLKDQPKVAPFDGGNAYQMVSKQVSFGPRNPNSLAHQEALNFFTLELKKYADTNVLIEGHTDSDGSDAYNQTLSEKRASTVADYVKQLGVTGSRITTKGYGESQPVASNDTPEGKQANRRVEIAVFANDKLKKAAEKGTLPPVKG